MKILVLGLENEDRILSILRKDFPGVGFKKCRISDDLEAEGRDITALDSVKGIISVILIDELGSLSPKVIEGSETLLTFRILKSIGSIDSARVIAVPEGADPQEAVSGIKRIMKDLK